MCSLKKQTQSLKELNAGVNIQKPDPLRNIYANCHSLPKYIKPVSIHYYRDLKLLKDVRQTEYVKKELQTYGLDRVEVQEYDVVVTYPDPDRPNQLVVINSSGRVVKNVTLSKSKVTKKVEEIIEDGRGGDVTRLSPNKVEVLQKKPVK